MTSAIGAVNVERAPVSLRTRGFRVAFYALIVQILITVLLIGLAIFVSEDDVFYQLMRQGGLLAGTLAHMLMWAGIFATLIYNWTRGRDDSRDQLLIARQLADLLKLGMPLPQALEALSGHQARDWRSRFSAGSQVLGFMARTTAHGDRLGQAMSRVDYFPEHWPRLLDIAEVKGVLIEVLETLHVGRSRSSWFTLWFFIRLFALIFVTFPTATFLVTYILPTFVALFEGMSLTLPAATQVLIFVTKAARNTWPLLFAPFILAFVGLRAYLNPAFRRRVLNTLYQLPPFNVILPLEDQAAVAMVMSRCLELGLSEQEALEVAARATQHPTYRQVLGYGHSPGITPEVPPNFSGGIPHLMDAHPGLFAAPLRWLARQGHRQGNLEAALASAAMHLSEVAEARKLRWSTYFDSLSAVLLGLLVGGIVIATFLPIQGLVVALLESLVLP